MYARSSRSTQLNHSAMYFTKEDLENCINKVEAKSAHGDWIADKLESYFNINNLTLQMHPKTATQFYGGSCCSQPSLQELDSWTRAGPCKPTRRGRIAILKATVNLPFMSWIHQVEQ
jgi:hypothetical protein